MEHTFIFPWFFHFHLLTSPPALPGTSDLYHTPELLFLAPVGVTASEMPTDFSDDKLHNRGNQSWWRSPGKEVTE